MKQLCPSVAAGQGQYLKTTMASWAGAVFEKQLWPS